MRIYTDKPRPVILSALEKMASVVVPTFGPNGKGSLLDTGFSQSIVDDGFMVMERFEVEDELENAVVKFVRDAARKTNSRAGDGTTTAFILMHTLVQEAFGDSLVFKNDQDTDVEQELRSAVKRIADKIRTECAKPIETLEELTAIARNSYGNEEVAKIIAGAVKEVGKDGVVTVESSDALETTSKVTKGLSIERGYISKFMVSNESGEVELNNPLICITDAVLSTAADITPVMEEALKNKREVLFIAEDVIGEALQAIVVNKLRGSIIAAAIKAPGFGEHKFDLLEDIAVVTGGAVVSARTGRPLGTLSKADLGSARRVKIAADMTVIVEGAGTQEAVDTRVSAIRTRASQEASKVDADRLAQRLAKLAGGVAVIRVGAATESEAKSMRFKVEDAVNATHLAYREGVVTGGGMLLKEMDSGSSLLNRALQAPRSQLLSNGAKALTPGAVDPAGVVIAALESAVSVAVALITCGSIIAEKREEPKD